MRGRFSRLFHFVHHFLEGMDVRNIVYVVLLTVISCWWVHQFKQYILGSVELKGYDDVTYTLEWQYNVNPSDPTNEWKTYASGSAKVITFTLDETNCEYYWRVLVHITGVKR